MASQQTARPQIELDQRIPWYIVGALCGVLLWAYWNTIHDILMPSWVSAQYSHGFLIPLFAAVLISMRRQPIPEVPAVERWCGVAILLASLTFRTAAAYFHALTYDIISIIPSLVGVFVIAGGWSMLRWAAAPILFLVFMIPLPEKPEHRLLEPLQNIATNISTYTLQTIGVEAYHEGNKIILGDNFPLNVEEQCSGLRMATIFLALAVAMILIIDRPWWQKGIIVVSAIPIAILVNMIRIVITALMFRLLGPNSELAHHFFHDLAGWFMMPLALGFMYLEMQLMDHMLIQESTAMPQSAGFGAQPKVREPAASRAP